MVHTALKIVASFLNSEILCFNVHLQVATLDPDASVSEARAIARLDRGRLLIRRKGEATSCALGKWARWDNLERSFCDRFFCQAFFIYCTSWRNSRRFVGLDPHEDQAAPPSQRPATAGARFASESQPTAEENKPGHHGQARGENWSR